MDLNISGKKALVLGASRASARPSCKRSQQKRFRFCSRPQYRGDTGKL